MVDLVLVGQAPNRSSDPSDPLAWETVAGARLAGALSLTREEYEAVPRFNLLSEWPGLQGEGDAFPMADASLAARKLAPELDGRLVVALGWRVGKCLGWPQGSRRRVLAWLPVSWYDRGVVRFKLAVVPHPSGRSRWWQDVDNVERASAFLRACYSPPAPPRTGRP